MMLRICSTLAVCSCLLGLAAAGSCVSPRQGAPLLPDPGLTWCYKFNEFACCNSFQDSQISGGNTEHLAASCGRLYPDLEDYYCLGCNPDQELYISFYNGTDEGTQPAPAGTTAYVSGVEVDVTGKLGQVRISEGMKAKLLYKDPSGSETDDSAIDMYNGCGLMLGAATGGPAQGSNGVLSSSFFRDAAAADSGTCNCTASDDEMTTQEQCESNDCQGVWTWTWDCEDDCTAADVFFEIFRPTFFEKENWDISFEATGGLSSATGLGALSPGVLLGLLLAQNLL